MPACTKLFAITELAEAIFLQFPMQELLQVQRTCRQWHDIIQTSSLIQEHLFLRPILKDSERLSKAEGRRAAEVILEHPYAFLLNHPNPPAAFRQHDASWRLMLLTQPPLDSVRISVSESNAGLDLSTVSAAGDGVTMGQLASHGVIHCIKGFSSWRLYEDFDQLRALKLDMQSQAEACKFEQDGWREIEVESDDDWAGSDDGWMEELRW